MSGTVSGVEVRLLGPLQLVGEHAPVALGGPKEQGVLAVLALSANEAVTEGALIDAVWGDDAPASALKVLQNNILRLRKTLAAAAIDERVLIEKRPGGYALVIAPEAVDVHVADGLLAAARAAIDRRNPAKAAALLRSALDCWRGPALSGLDALPFAAAATARLSELRLILEEQRVDAELELGRHAELVPTLHELIAAEPLRERFRAQLMIALHRSGRQAEALRCFQDARRILADELGLDPSPALVALEREIATSSPALAPQSDFPAGFVTFVATEIDGASRLLQSLGDRYATVLAEYHELLRSVFAEHGGIVVKTEDDRVLAVFAHAHDALAAAASVQLRLHNGPIRPALRPRIGLQSSNARLNGREYEAAAINGAERICQAGTGGQTLVGDATAQSAAQHPDSALRLVDLGTHMLLGFTQNERLYQLDHVDLVSAFPPLRTVASTPHNLPRLRTSFVGRAEEMAEVGALLERSGVVTLVGPGGVGKTRLAVEVGFVALSRYPDGVWLVDLVEVDDPSGVPDAVARVLGVGDAADTSAIDGVVNALRTRHLLLILDNCEHVIDAAAEIAERITTACPRVALLSTSRESLRIDGEVPWRLTPLRAPDPDSHISLVDAMRDDAVTLLVDRARSASPNIEFTDDDSAGLAAIAHGLDGLPLALELVAARIGDLGTDAVATELHTSMSLLSAGRRTAAPRHQTMRATIEWGYELLQPDERTLLRRLAVFAGGFTESAAIEVCGDGLDEPDVLLRELVHRSMVVSDDRDAGKRFRVLETVREFVADASADEVGDAFDATQRAHLLWITRFAKQQAMRLEQADEADALAALDSEIANVRSALRWSLDGADPAAGLALATHMAGYWSVRGRYSEGADVLTRALELAVDAAPAVRAEGLLAAGRMFSNVDTARPLPAHEAALAIFRELGDRRAVFRALRAICQTASRSGEVDVFARAATEALDVAEELRDRRLRADALGQLATLHDMRGEFDESRRCLLDELKLRATIDDDRERAWTLGKLGLLASRFEDFADARAKFVDMLDVCRRLGYRGGEAWARCGVASVAFDTGDLASARSHFERAVAIHRELDMPLDAGWSFGGLARVHLAQNDVSAARGVLAELLLSERGASDGYGWPWHHLALVNVADGRWGEAVMLFAAAGKVSEGTYTSPLAERDSRELAASLSECRQRLGDEAFDRNWERGRALARHDVNAIAVMPAG